MANSPFQSTLSEKAQREIADSWGWYEDRQRGLGDRFVTEVVNTIRVIEDILKHSASNINFTEKRQSAYSLLLLFRFTKRNKRIYIISVFHTSRNPKKKK